MPDSSIGDDVGDPPFDRQQVSFTLGGPLRRQRLFGFGALEVRNQDGGVLVGVRDPATQDDRSARMPRRRSTICWRRFDWTGARVSNDDVTIRYSGQREDDIAASTVERAIGTASQRQQSRNRLQAVLGSWTRILSPRAVNALSVSFSDFDNQIAPVEPGVQLTFPSLQAGSSFRVPQGTQRRSGGSSPTRSRSSRGTHQWKFGGQLQRVDAEFDLGVFRDGRIELVEDFPAFDRNGDGRVDDDDLLFAVTLRSGKPDQDLVIPDADNVHLAGYVQDDWRVHPRLSLNLGLRYEIDTDVNNISRVDELNPIVVPFVNRAASARHEQLGAAHRLQLVDAGRPHEHSRRLRHLLRSRHAADPIARARPRRPGAADRGARRQPSVHRSGDRPRAAVRAEPCRTRSPASSCPAPAPPASTSSIRDLQNPKVQQMSLGIERQLGARQVVRVDVVHNHGTDFIIGRTVGTVFNPVVGGPDRVVNLESSAKTDYDALLVEFERRFTGRFGFRAAYTLSSCQ